MLTISQRRKLYANLAALVSAGLVPSESLSTLSLRARPGEALSEALHRLRLVPAAELAVLEVGEQTGSLEVAARLLADHAERLAAFSVSTRQALRYPLLLVILAPFILGVPALFMGSSVGWYLLNAAGSSVVLLGPVVAAWVVWRRGALVPAERRALLGVIRHVPVVGSTLISMELQQFLSMASVMIAAGIGPREAFERLGEATADGALAAGAHAWSARVDAGLSMGEAFEAFEAIGVAGRSMMQTGAQTGRLPEMLTAASRVVSESLDERLKTLQVVLPTAGLLGALFLILLQAAC